MSRAGELGIGISEFVSVGNKADVSGNDLLQHWETDPNTDVILFYLESFGNPRKFARLARRVARRKAIVAVKSGRTQAGSRAASSHTAALATPDVAVDALFRQAGVIRVDTLEQLLDTAQVLAHQPLPHGPAGRDRRATRAGRASSRPTRARAPASRSRSCRRATQDALRDVRRAPTRRSAIRSTSSPPRRPSSTSARSRVVLADDGVDAVLALFVPPLVTAAEDVARAIASAAAGAGDKPVVACFLGRSGVPTQLRGSGDDAARSRRSRSPKRPRRRSARAADLADWRRRPPGTVPAVRRHRRRRRPPARRSGISTRWRRPRTRRTWLDADRRGPAPRLLRRPACCTPHVVDVRRRSGAAAERRSGYPVALKAGGADIVHKTDVGGVALGLTRCRRGTRARTPTWRRGSATRWAARSCSAWPTPGVETIVGVTQDPSFGPLVLFGLGGVTAELLADRTLRLVPMTDVDAHEVVRSLRARRCCSATADSPPVDVAALEDLLLRVARSPTRCRRSARWTCNPVIVSATGRDRGRRQDPAGAGRRAAAAGPPPLACLSARPSHDHRRGTQTCFHHPDRETGRAVHALRPAGVPRLPDPGVGRLPVLRVRAGRARRHRERAQRWVAAPRRSPWVTQTIVAVTVGAYLVDRARATAGYGGSGQTSPTSPCAGPAVANGE